MIKRRCTLPLIVTFIASVVSADGITVVVPEGNLRDVNIDSTRIDGNPDKVLNTISFVNEYLWFLIGFLCFIFLIYNGVKLVAARGDKEDMKKATKGLTGSAIGIAICSISYAFVRVIVNLL